ncbi:hypothetical protein SAMN04489733_2679 [Amycolatopsis keratiniphila]|nr:hypothetical protein SAMN04489733_2679 [Amycolatopsis keratiniphila]
MRARPVFTVYLVFVVAVLGYCVLLGLLHR